MSGDEAGQRGTSLRMRRIVALLHLEAVHTACEGGHHRLNPCHPHACGAHRMASSMRAQSQCASAGRRSRCSSKILLTPLATSRVRRANDMVTSKRVDADRSTSLSSTCLSACHLSACSTCSAVRPWRLRSSSQAEDGSRAEGGAVEAAALRVGHLAGAAQQSAGRPSPPPIPFPAFAAQRRALTAATNARAACANNERR